MDEMLDRMDYVPEQAAVASCPTCGDTGWVHSLNSPDHPCSRCLSANLRGESRQPYLYTSSKESNLREA